MSNHAAKRDYLVGKMVDGAKAVDELFERVEKRPSIDLNKTGDILARKYGLTENQQEYLQKIVPELSAAVKIVRYVRNEYGVNKYGEIKDKERLYKDVFDEELPKTDFYVKVFPFSVGFYLPDSYLPDKGGDTADAEFFPTQIAPKLVKGEKKYMKHTGMMFRVNEDSTKPRTRDEHVLSILDLGKKYKIERHEQKHIIDRLMPANRLFLTHELSAYLYSHGLSLGNIKRDVKTSGKRIVRVYEHYKEIKRLKAPKLILDNQKMSR